MSSEKIKLVENAAGRLVPAEINGEAATPFQGVGKYRPTGRKNGPPLCSAADYPPDGNKVVESLKQALVNAGIRDGMTVSSAPPPAQRRFKVANPCSTPRPRWGCKDLHAGSRRLVSPATPTSCSTWTPV
jgi:hypothetical protein